jgi:hypothetical protein
LSIKLLFAMDVRGMRVKESFISKFKQFRANVGEEVLVCLGCATRRKTSIHREVEFGCIHQHIHSTHI